MLTHKKKILVFCVALVKSFTKLTKLDNLTEKQDDNNGEVDEGEMLCKY